MPSIHFNHWTYQPKKPEHPLRFFIVWQDVCANKSIAVICRILNHFYPFSFMARIPPTASPFHPYVDAQSARFGVYRFEW